MQDEKNEQPRLEKEISEEKNGPLFEPESGKTMAMPEPEPPVPEEAVTFGQAVAKGFRETFNTFRAFVHSPKEIIGINLINIFEGMAYFGTLTYLVLYMNENVGLEDKYASYVVTAFMMIVTISQLLFGGVTDKLGAKKAMGIALAVLLAGRVVIGFAEPVLGESAGTGLTSPLFVTVACALLFVALAYGLYQPSIYTATRQFSDKKASAVAYAMLYAGMNLGAFIIGLMLPPIRKVSALYMGNNGYSGSLIYIAGIMVFAFICYIFLIYRSKSKPHEALETHDDEQKAHSGKSLIQRIKEHPLADLKFDFFIFILIPVQTLFAYQNILVPAYLERCYTNYPTISDNFETFSNLNPLIVFIAAPVIAAMTARSNVYKMMIIGTAVMAVPTFLLCLGQHPATFLSFVLLMSIGESMWQPRFLQHVAEIAPKEHVGAYIGIAQLPWFLTKFIVGLYAGHFMQIFMPAKGIQHPETMWFIFACIALVSPVALFLARHWMNPSQKKAEG